MFLIYLHFIEENQRDNKIRRKKYESGADFLKE